MIYSYNTYRSIYFDLSILFFSPTINNQSFEVYYKTRKGLTVQRNQESTNTVISRHLSPKSASLAQLNRKNAYEKSPNLP